MNVHEYQAKQLLKSYGIAVPAGGVAATPAEAEAVARTLSGPAWVVKAQIHAGGRGPAGGVQIVHSVDDAKMVAELMLGSQLTTAQTAPQGVTVKQVYIEQGCSIVRSFYLALLVDTLSDCLSFLVSPERGSESIEEIALKHPERVCKIVIDPEQSLQTTQAQELATTIGLGGDQADVFVRYLQLLYDAFTQMDATLIEISPLVVTDEGILTALDAKMSFDNNALFRHPTIKALQDNDSTDPIELAAAQQGLNYFKLDGTIGTMVSGAGLAMATLDAIIECNGKAANFLDVPPMARQSQVAAAFKLLLSDDRLACILVNVFGGGIMRCDTIADGIIAALRESQINPANTLPLVVRLTGTNVEIGRKKLQDSGFTIHFATDLADAASQALKYSQKPQSLQTKSSSLLTSVRQKLSRGKDNQQESS